MFCQFLDYFPAVYIMWRDFFFRERNSFRVDQSSVEIRVLWRALLGGYCCDRNQAIILVVLVLFSL